MRRHAALTVLGLAQGLRNHGLQRLRQHGADHFLFFARKHVNDPINRFGGARGMQRAKHQMPGFGRGHGEPDCLEIAHFADQNGVRVFAQRRAQGGREAQRVGANFALVDQAFF